MAGYRPKSLDELNSLYDKSLNAKNEIEKKALDLEVKKVQYAPAAETLPEAESVSEPISNEAAGEEITGLVDDFIKSFGAPVPIKKVRPATVAATAVKSVAPVKSAEAKAPVKESAPVQSPTPSVVDRPKLIRNSERNDLFEDYKKVMDDEDEDEYSRHRRGRKRGKKLFEKKSAEVSAQPEEELQQAAQTVEAIADEAVELGHEVETVVPVYEITEEQSETVAEPEIPETLENIDAVIEKVLGRPLEQPTEEPAQETADEAAQEVTQEASQEISEEAAEVTAEEEAEEIAEAVEEAAYEAEPEQEAEQVEEVQEPADEAADGAYEEQQEAAFIPVYVAQEEEEEQLPELTDAAEEATFEEPVGEVYFEAPVKKRYAGKNVLLVLLFLVLLLATAVSAVKAFAGINSDSLVLDKYHIYTAQSSYEQAGIKKGDLVVVTHEGIEEGDIFAFKKGNGEYGFAKLDSVLNEESVVADNDGQKSIVFKNTLRGVFYKTYPVIGTVAALIVSHYLYITGALLLIAAILIFVILFAFRKKKEQGPELQDAYEQEVAAADNSEYEAIEDDFRYLIQEDSEDDFDVYRNGYSEESQDEGLPVYQDENYKYEPDEYVRN